MKAIPRFLACVNTEATTLYLLVKNNYSKNICHYITVIVISESCSVISNYLWLHGLYSPWNSPDQYSGVGSLSHLQGIFPTQGSNAGLLHCRQILYQLSHKGSPRILEWADFSSGSSIQSMEFSRPEYWSGLPFPSPRDLPNPGIKRRSPALQADSLPAEPPGKHNNWYVNL